MEIAQARPEAVLSALKDPDPDVRAWSAASLGDLGRIEACRPLIAIVEDAEESHDVRAAAATALGQIEHPESLPALVELALRRRPDLELARRGERASLAAAERWRAETRWTPSVYVGAYATHAADSASVTAGLSFPVPAFDRNQGLEGRARSDADGQRRLARALEIRVAREVTGAWNAREHARAALARFRAEGLVTGEALVRRAEVTYQTGSPGGAGFTVQDLFDAYRALWDARAQELDLMQTFAEAEADLERAAALVVP
jgi:cobalt-zinc-cadmium efflux system outer membrane protein